MDAFDKDSATPGTGFKCGMGLKGFMQEERKKLTTALTAVTESTKKDCVFWNTDNDCNSEVCLQATPVGAALEFDDSCEFPQDHAGTMRTLAQIFSPTSKDIDVTYFTNFLPRSASLRLFWNDIIVKGEELFVKLDRDDHAGLEPGVREVKLPLTKEHVKSFVEKMKPTEDSIYWKMFQGMNGAADSLAVVQAMMGAIGDQLGEYGNDAQQDIGSHWSPNSRRKLASDDKDWGESAKNADAVEKYQEVTPISFSAFSEVIANTKERKWKVFYAACQCATGLATGAATGGIMSGTAIATCGALATTLASLVTEALWPDLESAQVPQKVLVEIGFAKQYADELSRVLKRLQPGEDEVCYGFEMPGLVESASKSLTCAVKKLHAYASETKLDGNNVRFDAKTGGADIDAAAKVLRQYRDMMMQALQLVQLEVQLQCSRAISDQMVEVSDQVVELWQNGNWQALSEGEKGQVKARRRNHLNTAGITRRRAEGRATAVVEATEARERAPRLQAPEGTDAGLERERVQLADGQDIPLNDELLVAAQRRAKMKVHERQANEEAKNEADAKAAAYEVQITQFRAARAREAKERHNPPPDERHNSPEKEDTRMAKEALIKTDAMQDAQEDMIAFTDKDEKSWNLFTVMQRLVDLQKWMRDSAVFASAKCDFETDPDKHNAYYEKRDKEYFSQRQQANIRVKQALEAEKAIRKALEDAPAVRVKKMDEGDDHEETDEIFDPDELQQWRVDEGIILPKESRTPLCYMAYNFVKGYHFAWASPDESSHVPDKIEDQVTLNYAYVWEGPSFTPRLYRPNLSPTPATLVDGTQQRIPLAAIKDGQYSKRGRSKEDDKCLKGKGGVPQGGTQLQESKNDAKGALLNKMLEWCRTLGREQSVSRDSQLAIRELLQKVADVKMPYKFPEPAINVMHQEVREDK